jgi:hypothetical protein
LIFRNAVLVHGLKPEAISYSECNSKTGEMRIGAAGEPGRRHDERVDDSVKRVNALIYAFANATREQTNGIGQVNQAVVVSVFKPDQAPVPGRCLR